MKKQQTRIALAVAGACAMLAAGSASALEVYNTKGWKLDVSGSVNAFYTAVKTDGADRSSNIENGLLPGYINFAATTQQNGYDIKAVLGFWPGINSGQIDTRTNYLSFGNANMGSVKMGRDIGLFQSNTILNDMTLLGVGGGAGLARAINTTLGGIGAGYVYAEFQPQITYTTPKLGILSASVGMFDSKDVNAAKASGKQNGFQGMVEADLPGGKAWVSFVQQKFSLVRDASASGVEVGAKIDVGPLGLMGSGFSGKGIGDTILFDKAFDTAGDERKSNGYLLQATYKIGDLKVGANVGQSRTKLTSAEGSGDANKVQGKTLGLYYSLTPALTLVGEVNQRDDKVADAKTKTVSAGAILFF